MSDKHTVGIVIRADGSSLVAEVEKSKKSLVDLTESTRKVGAETGKATSEIGRLDNSMSRTAESSSRAARELAAMSTQSRGLSSVVAGWQQTLGVVAAVGGIVAGLKSTVTAYASFEEGLIAVGKTADLEGSRLAQFGTRIDDLSHRMPVATEQLLDIAQAAGQLGVKGEENILRFTETVARMGSSTNLSGSEAATALARMLNVTRESMESVGTLGSVWVALGNNFATTEAEIARTANEVARATSTFGVSSANASALAAAMASIGIQAELGGSSVGRVMREMDAAIRAGGEGLKSLEELTGQTGGQLKKIFAEDATKAFQLFLQGLGRVIDEGGDATEELKKFNLSGEEILKTLPAMARASGEVGRAMEIAGRETKNATALVTESDKAFKSFNSEMQLLGNTITSIATAIGSKLAPALETMSRGLRRLLTDDADNVKFEKLVEERLSLTDKITKSESRIAQLGTYSASGQSISSSLIPARTRLGELDQEIRRLQDANIERQRSEDPSPHMTTGVPPSTPKNPKNAPVEEKPRPSAPSRDTSDLRFIENLRREREELKLTDQQRYVSEVSRRLSASATNEQREAVARLAEDLFSEKQAMEEQSRSRNRHLVELQQEQTLSQSLSVAQGHYQSELQKTDGLLQQTADSHAHLAKAADEAYGRMEQASDQWSDGVARAANSYAKEAMDSARNWEIATTNAFRGMEDALVSFITTGKADWKGLVDSILADLARIAVRESITGPLAKALGMGMSGGSSSGSAGSGFSLGDAFEGVGSLVSSIFHDGGIVGDGAISRRSVPSQIFIGAPRFHSGGIIGPDEVPIIAQRGERVLSRKQNKAYEAGQTGVGDSSGRVEVQIINVTNPDMIKRLVADTIAEKKDTVVNMVLNAMDERNLVVRRF